MICRHIKVKHCLLWINLLLFYFGCITPEPANQFTCNFIPSDIKPPHWVVGDNSLDGYYVGIGQAEKKHADSDSDELIKQARSNALENLAQNIQVKVKSNLNMTRIHNADSNGITFSEKISSDVSTHSDLTISNTHQDGLWLDQQKCIVWMRIKVKQAFVDNLFMISQAESNYETARHKELSLKDRLEKIKESIALIRSVDFPSVPSKGKPSMYLEKYQTLLSSLEKQSESCQLMYVVQAPDIIQPSIRDALVKRLMDTHQRIPAWYEKSIDCLDIKNCLDMARTSRAIYLAHIQLKPEVSRVGMGFSEALLSLSLTVHNVQTGQILHQENPKPVTSSVFDEKYISWERMINEILNGITLNEITLNKMNLN
ncbi:MAG: LPP20 family lipoprotein [Candidatus Magnetomorum sp.]|nr:LPP20 family lipoprotein [Candidatus Magnetomorum sp.]